MAHFTYAAVPDFSTLRQGDLISRTEQVERILEDVHPHYYRTSNYRYFVVLTQSCDLIRRNGDPSPARYISIAAVRPFHLALDREAKSLLRSDLQKKLGICEDSRRVKLEQFLERLYNNNEDRYFFLYREPNAGLEEDHCAFLKLSISVKSALHYDSLLDAKKLELEESFQHKLGYLVGQAYSRVGTRDWVPDGLSAEEFRDMIREALREVNGINWLEKTKYRKVVRQMMRLDPDARTVEKLEEMALAISGERQIRIDEVLEAVGVEVKKAGLGDSDIEKIRRRLQSATLFTRNIR